MSDFAPEGGRARVYCAGPLFNRSERQEMSAIADTLAEAGYPVFLPHRDGMEFRLVHEVLVRKGWPAAQAAGFLHAAIFALDVYQLAHRCGALVWNLNGRTPDEGAVAEAAMAWTLGKPVVAYKDDVRSLIAGRVNPLLVGMVEFRTVGRIVDLPAALAEQLDRIEPATRPAVRPPGLEKAVVEGERLWDVMQERNAACDDERIAEVVEELFVPGCCEPSAASPGVSASRKWGPPVARPAAGEGA